MSLQVRISWVEHFLNWYPRHTKLYRRRSKNDPPYFPKGMQEAFDELKPFFVTMKASIEAETKERTWEDVNHVFQAVLSCRNIEEVRAIVAQAVAANSQSPKD